MWRPSQSRHRLRTCVEQDKNNSPPPLQTPQPSPDPHILYKPMIFLLILNPVLNAGGFPLHKLEHSTTSRIIQTCRNPVIHHAHPALQAHSHLIIHHGNSTHSHGHRPHTEVNTVLAPALVDTVVPSSFCIRYSGTSLSTKAVVHCLQSCFRQHSVACKSDQGSPAVCAYSLIDRLEY